MAEELPDGTYQGYYNICKNCGKEIQVNMQGNPINHKCEDKKLIITKKLLINFYYYMNECSNYDNGKDFEIAVDS